MTTATKSAPAEARKDVLDDQERALWDAYRRPSERDEVHTRLVEHYLPLVVRIVERMSIRVREKIEAQELVSAGVLGLHRAIMSYQRDKNVTFSTFAYRRIHGAIIDELRKQDHLTRHQRGTYREICAAIRHLTETNGSAPKDDEIAAAVELSVDQVHEYIGMASNAQSLFESESDGDSPYVILADKNAECPADAADIAIARDELRQAFRHLESRDQQILYLRYNKGLRVREIAEVFSISEGRVSQIYKSIILKLRAIMKIG